MDLTQNNNRLTLQGYIDNGSSSIDLITRYYLSTHVGYQAGLKNIGYRNQFYGYQVGYSNTTGQDQIFIGYGAGNYSVNGCNSILIGNYAGYNSTSQQSNLFIGINSGRQNQTGYLNIAIGNYSLENCTDGANNLAIGNGNIAFGNSAGQASLQTNYNTFIGYGTAQSNINLSFNTCVGAFTNCSGQYSCSIGYNSTTTGDYTISIGQNIYQSSSASNCTIIGKNVSNSGSNVLLIMDNEIDKMQKQRTDNNLYSNVQNNYINIQNIIYGDLGTSNISIGGNLQIQNNIEFKSNVQIDGSLNVLQNFQTSNIVSSNIQSSNGLFSNINANYGTISNQLNVLSNASFQGIVNAQSNVNVSGILTSSNTFYALSDANISGNLNAQSNINTNTLNASQINTQNQTVSNDLLVSNQINSIIGITTQNLTAGSLNSTSGNIQQLTTSNIQTQNQTITNTLSVQQINASNQNVSNLNVSQNQVIGSNLTIDSNLSVLGNSMFSNQSTFQDVIVNGILYVPSSNIGSSTSNLALSNLIVSSNAQVQNLTVVNSQLQSANITSLIANLGTFSNITINSNISSSNATFSNVNANYIFAKSPDFQCRIRLYPCNYQQSNGNTNYWDFFHQQTDTNISKSDLVIQSHSGCQMRISDQYISSVTSFTGQHKLSYMSKDQYFLGCIVSVINGKLQNMFDEFSTYNHTQPDLSESLPIVELNKKTKSTSVMGVVNKFIELGSSDFQIGYISMSHQNNKFHQPKLEINSCGNSYIAIQYDQKLRIGDLITTSSKYPGLGVRQKKNSIMNYTVGKSLQNSDNIEIIREFQNIKYKLIACNLYC